MMRFGLLLIAAVATCFLPGLLLRGWSDDETPLPPPKVEPLANPKPSELMAMLEETIDRRDIAEPMTFGEAIDRLNVILARRGKWLPVRFNGAAFREAAHGDPLDPRTVPVTCPALPARLQVRHLLMGYLDHFPCRNASFIIGPGYLEITTKDRSMPFERLSTPVTLQVRSRPLFLVLDDLFEQTGVSIIVDARFAQRARIPVSATIADPVSLRDALYILCNMADLHMVTVGNAVYVTSPQNAYRVYWEQQVKSLMMLDPRSPEI